MKERSCGPKNSDSPWDVSLSVNKKFFFGSYRASMGLIEKSHMEPNIQMSNSLNFEAF